MNLEPGLAQEPYCYLTTTGRVTGKPHEIEIWFGLVGSTIYLLAGGRDKSDWVRNLIKQPEAAVRIAGRVFTATARVLAEDDPDDAMARDLLVQKYTWSPTRDTPGADLSDWGRRSLVVALELHAEQA